MGQLVVCALLVGGGVVQGEEPAYVRGEHWAFRPVKAVKPPKDESGWARTEIDRFVAAGLRGKGLEPNPDADRRTLIRRAYFDLIGLPPTPEQIGAFLEDTSPRAFEKVVEELLGSPHYGERWGRHWLDVARYADTSGDGADAPIPEARHYRQYVIDSFNEDLPYDQFIIEQIAGDILAKQNPDKRARERIIATSYIGLSRRFNNGEYRDMHLVIENTLSTIGKGMMGMTIGCARCHDHKFDPISAEDYYGLYGYFESTQYPHAGTESGRKRKNFTELPGGGLAYAVFDKEKKSDISDTRIQIKGEPGSKGGRAPRGFLSVLEERDPEIPEGESGRLQLAKWIASADNPLTTRVIVNRIWQYHFGRGIVASPNTFGLQGKQPTHPELLDWLAERFVEDGWSIKQMHRHIMNSRVYQLASDTREEAMEKDPGNDWLWRFTRRRLEAEPLRDSVLFLSGRLKQGAPPESPLPKPNKNNEYPYTQHRPFSEDYDHDHRTVYLPIRRLGKHPYMETFNGPNANECTASREVSTVPLQSLFWMNSGFIDKNCESFAGRLLESGQDDRQRLGRAMELVYGRLPKTGEAEGLLAYLADYRKQLPDKLDEAEREKRAWTSVCRILLASNEFVYLN